ncbi:MAG: lysylphosphatidylglycerol synthase domain-containing protein [Synechococcaceae cyanobacterium]
MKLPPLPFPFPGPRLRRIAGSLRRLPLPGGISLWITLLSFGFLLAALVGHGRRMLQLSLDPQGWWWLLLGVGFSLLSLVVNAVGFGAVLRWLELRPRWPALVTLYLDTNLRKFLPGGIWHLAGRLAPLRAGDPLLRQPAPLTLALLAVLLDPLLAAVAALALVPVAGWQNGLALLCLLPLLLLWPRWLAPLLERLERRQARRLQLEPAALTALGQGLRQALSGYPWPPLLVQLAFVLLRFAGFACCVLAFDLHTSLAWSGWLAGFALAWTIGLVVPGAPGGLGVFEAALLLRLGGAIPEAPLLAIALSYRLVATLADLAGAGCARLDDWLDRRLAQAR